MVSVSHRRREAAFGFRDGSMVSSEGIERFSPLAAFKGGPVGRNPRGHRLSIFIMRAIKQSEAVNHIKHLLRERGLDITEQSGAQRMVIFEHKGKQIGVDSASGVWVRASEGSDWRCLAMPCTVSGAIQAVEFLAKE
jgi:hypothetical protein